MRRAPWVAIAMLAFCVGAALLPESGVFALEYDRSELAAGEWWRAWSGHCVHYSARHAIVDVIALFIVSLAIEIRCGHGALIGLIIVIPPLLSLTLYFSAPSLTAYRGASGICVAFAFAVSLEIWRESKTVRATLLVLACLFVLKTMCEMVGVGMNFSGISGDVRIAWQAHLFGATFGVLGFCVLRQFAFVEKPVLGIKKIVLWSSDSIC